MTADRTTLRPGLCSVTFRGLDCDTVIGLATRAGLAAIEWGTDVHLPPGDLARARDLARRCADAGLATPTLGSYLRSEDGDDDSLNDVLDTAEAIGAARIRVWAGRKGSAEAGADDRAAVAANVNRYCEAAAARGLAIALEFHPNTLTDTAPSAAALLNAVPHPGLRSYWQPKPDMTAEMVREEIALIAHRLSDLHVFHWVGEAKVRRPLAEGRGFWAAAFAAAAELAPAPDNAPRHAFMEFVQDDSPDRFIADAAVFTDLCAASDATSTNNES